MCGEFVEAQISPAVSPSQRRSPAAEPSAFLPSPPALSRRNSITQVDSEASSPYLAPTDASEASLLDLHAEATSAIAQIHDEWVHTVRFVNKTGRIRAPVSEAKASVPKPSFLRRPAQQQLQAAAHKVTRNDRFWYEPYNATVF